MAINPALRKLHPAGRNPKLGWVHHVVRPLLLRAVDFCPAPPGLAGRSSAGNHQAPGEAVGIRAFAGHEGIGCTLSRAEREILERVKHEPMSWEM